MMRAFKYKSLVISFKARCMQALGYDVALPEDGYHGEYLIALAQECYNTYGTELLSKTDEFFSTYAKEHLLKNIQKNLAEYGITFDVWFSEKTLHDSGAIEQALKQLAASGHLYTEDGTHLVTINRFWGR